MTLLDSVMEQLIERYSAAEVAESFGKFTTNKEKYAACICWDVEAVLMLRPMMVEEIPGDSAVVTVEVPDKKGGYLAVDTSVEQVHDDDGYELSHGIGVIVRNKRQRPVW